MKVIRFVLAVLLAAGVAASASAFSFVPMSASLSPSGAQSVMSFKVTNDTAQAIAVVIKVMTRSIDIEGVESNQPVGSEFIVFPTRVVVQPNSFQTIKVQYKGTASLPRELCYRVMAEQVPIDFSKQETSGVKVLFRYIAALYVTPPKAAPKLSVSDLTGAEKDGKKGLMVTLKNDGSRHALLSNPKLQVKDSDPSSLPVALSGDAVLAIEGQNMLPSSSRSFFVLWEPAVVGTSYTGTFDAEIE